MSENCKAPELLKYLQELAREKEDPLVQYGEGEKLPLDGAVIFDDPGNLDIIKREKNDGR